ncbi:MAG: RelA/SpoT domain-containing protein [Actinomycetota bacterium]|nr:RelA/SpoT domain-containing protein [Actinomycetota bacterium]
MAAATVFPTNNQINKAGKKLRAWWGGLELTREDLYPALDVVSAYRASHRKPMTHANMGLRSVVKSQGCQAKISQRLKQMQTIVGKLERYPKMALTTMQDIAGCRAIVEDILQLRRIEAKLVANSIARTGSPPKVDDYLKTPKASGYRGVHVIVQYGNPPRSIEVQLRTPVMHGWAYTVERLGGKIGQDLKSGYGPPEVLRLMEAISEAMELEERDEPVDSALVDRINDLRRDALPFMVARPNGRSTP